MVAAAETECDAVTPGEHEEEAVDEEEDAKDTVTQVFTLKLLLLIHEAQQRHGLIHGDYQRYRSYCCRRIRRIRKMLHFVQGTRKNFRRKDVVDEVITDEKFLYIPVMMIERAWSYSMQLKQEANSEQRKRFHLLSRLRKAAKMAEQFQNLCQNSCHCDARTKLEVQAYSLFITATLQFETRQWTDAMRSFSQSQAIYENLASALSEDEAMIYKAKADEMLPSIRFCAYSVGDRSAMEDLMQMKAGHNEMLATLLEETRAHQAAALSQVTWRGRSVSVQHEKVRTFLMSEQKLSATLDKCDDQLDVYDNFLMECKEVMNVVREELRLDASFKSYRSDGDQPVSSCHYLFTYLSYIRITSTIQRNLIIIDNTVKLLKLKQKGSDGRRVRMQDVVRLCDIIIQQVQELTQLATLENDTAVRAQVNAQISAFSALRCYYISQGYVAASQWKEAMLLYSRAEQHIDDACHSQILSDNLEGRMKLLCEQLKSAKLTVNARSIIASSQPADLSSNKHAANTAHSRKDLDERLDDYAAGLNADWLVSLPPQMQPVPCRPLFFDLALNHIQLPDIADKLGHKQATPTASNSANQGSGGLTGLVRGLWGWGGGKK